MCYRCDIQCRTDDFDIFDSQRSDHHYYISLYKYHCRIVHRSSSLHRWKNIIFSTDIGALWEFVHMFVCSLTFCTWNNRICHSMFVPVSIRCQTSKKGKPVCMRYERLLLKAMNMCISFDDWELYTWHLCHKRQATNIDL